MLTEEVKGHLENAKEAIIRRNLVDALNHVISLVESVVTAAPKDEPKKTVAEKPKANKKAEKVKKAGTEDTNTEDTNTEDTNTEDTTDTNGSGETA